MKNKTLILINALATIGLCSAPIMAKKTIIYAAPGGGSYYFNSNYDFNIYARLTNNNDATAYAYDFVINNHSNSSLNFLYDNSLITFYSDSSYQNVLSDYAISNVYLNGSLGGALSNNIFQEVSNSQLILYKTNLNFSDVITFNFMVYEPITYTEEQYIAYGEEQYELGYNEGYELGYNEGYELGYNDGFIAGVDNPDYNDVWGFLGSLFVGLAPILEIELFGFLPIGYLIAIPIIFAIFAFILGLFR